MTDAPIAMPPETVNPVAPNGKMSPEWFRFLQSGGRAIYNQAVRTTDLISNVTSLSTTVDGHTATLTTVQQSISGIEARWAVTVDVNGYVAGIELIGGPDTATFTVVVDEFLVADPGDVNGDPVPVFAVNTVGGTPKVALRGDMIVDGSITATKISVSALSAIAADIGTVTAGLIRNAADTLRFDLPNMRLYRTDGKMDVDLKNLRLRIGA